jgi:hypothetical protein
LELFQQHSYPIDAALAVSTLVIAALRQPLAARAAAHAAERMVIGERTREYRTCSMRLAEPSAAREYVKAITIFDYLADLDCFVVSDAYRRIADMHR